MRICLNRAGTTLAPLPSYLSLLASTTSKTCPLRHPCHCHLISRWLDRLSLSMMILFYLYTPTLKQTQSTIYPYYIPLQNCFISDFFATIYCELANTCKCLWLQANSARISTDVIYPSNSWNSFSKYFIHISVLLTFIRFRITLICC